MVHSSKNYHVACGHQCKMPKNQPHLPLEVKVQEGNFIYLLQIYIIISYKCSSVRSKFVYNLRWPLYPDRKEVA
jgi:hypothetical protein